MFQSPPPKFADRSEQDVKLLHRLASAHLLFGQHFKAMKLLQLAHFVDPNDARTIELMAFVAFRLGDLDYTLRAADLLEESGYVISAELSRLRYIATQRQNAASDSDPMEIPYID